MKGKETGDSMMMDILNDAFPGRSDEQVVPIGLVYAGVRWGRDYRFGDVPEDDTGQPVLVCDCSGETYRRYISWLAHYLYNLDAEPLEEQKGLCKYLSRMEPEDAVLMLGMNTAIYEWDAEDMEDCIKDGWDGRLGRPSRNGAIFKGIQDMHIAENCIM